MKINKLKGSLIVALALFVTLCAHIVEAYPLIQWKREYYRLSDVFFYAVQPPIVVKNVTYSPADLVFLNYSTTYVKVIYDQRLSVSGAYWSDVTSHHNAVTTRHIAKEAISGFVSAYNGFDEISLSSDEAARMGSTAPFDLSRFKGPLKFPDFNFAPDIINLNNLEPYAALNSIARIPYYALFHGTSTHPQWDYKGQNRFLTQVQVPDRIKQETGSPKLDNVKDNIYRVWYLMTDPKYASFFDAFFMSIYGAPTSEYDNEPIETWPGKIIKHHLPTHTPDINNAWTTLHAFHTPGTKEFAYYVRTFRLFATEAFIKKLYELGSDASIIESARLDSETKSQLLKILLSDNYDAKMAVVLISYIIDSSNSEIQRERVQAAWSTIDRIIDDISDDSTRAALLKYNKLLMDQRGRSKINWRNTDFFWTKKDITGSGYSECRTPMTPAK